MEDETREVQGEFWVPGRPNRKVPGILTISSDGGAHLALIGTFEDGDDMLKGRLGDYRRIIGMDPKNYYTLDGCIRTSHSISVGTMLGRQGFKVNQVITGAVFEQDEEVSVDRLRVSIANLLNWTKISGITEEWFLEEGRRGVSRIIITAEPQESLHIRTDFGGVRIDHVLHKTQRAMRGPELTQDLHVVFEFDDVISASDALQYVSDLQNLVSIATFIPSPFKKVEFSHPALIEDLGEGGERRAWPSISAEWNIQGRESEKVLYEFDLMFTFEQFGEAQGLANWFKVADEHRDLLGRVMATRYVQKPYARDLLLNRVVPLEAFHKRWSGVTSRVDLVDRLKDLADYAGEPFEKLLGSSEAISRWCAAAKDMRHDFAHHLGQYSGQHALEILHVSNAAYWLFIICLLRKCSASQALFENLTSCRQFRHHSSQIASVI
ncbi:ApeA N-terminal domain 1-containing protein [Amycolatopsis thermoflava]|uniref:ApeA N-terminal domain 1-containing protein n=1 Tax=Amycolatopsis thermoflava TaxID=84480 RepID=UPI003815789E